MGMARGRWSVVGGALVVALVWGGCGDGGGALDGGGAVPPATEDASEPPVESDSWTVDDDAGPTNTPDDAGPEPEPEPDPGPDPIVWLAAPAGCDAPSELPPDTLTVAASINPPADSVVHYQDIAIDQETGTVWVAGTSGLAGIRATPKGLKSGGKYPPSSGGGGPGGAETPEFEHVVPLGASLLALTSLADGHQTTEGLTLVDASVPKAIAEVGALAIDDPSGMAVAGDWLYVLQFTGQLTVVDISDPTAPSAGTTVAGLANPWEIVVDGDVAYVADNTLGVVVFDLADPSSPVIVGSVATAGGAQDVDVSDGVLFAAVGTAGIQTFDLADPLTPEPLAVVGYGTPVVAVSADAGRAGGADHEGVVVLDVTDPAAPVPVAVEDTEWWALDVVASGDRVYVADWKAVTVMDAGEGAAPDADPDQSEVFFIGSVTSRTIALSNRGAADLELVGVTLDDPRFTVEVDALTAPPGGSLLIRLTFADDGGPVDTTLCVATNDPDEPVQEITVADTSTEASVTIGEPAPDFVLPDLDGTLHSLSDHYGQPVVLAWFASW